MAPGLGCGLGIPRAGRTTDPLPCHTQTLFFFFFHAFKDPPSKVIWLYHINIISTQYISLTCAGCPKVMFCIAFIRAFMAVVFWIRTRGFWENSILILVRSCSCLHVISHYLATHGLLTIDTSHTSGTKWRENWNNSDKNIPFGKQKKEKSCHWW